MNLRLVVPSLLVLAVAGGILVYTSRPPGGKGAPTPVPPPPPRDAHRRGGPDGPFHPEPVRIETLPTVHSIPATVDAPQEVVLTCSLPSPFVEIPVHEGSAVRKGDLLARVRSEPFEKRLAEAIAAKDPAKEAKAREDLAQIEIRAPVDGIVFRLEVRVGDMPPRNRGGPRPAVTLLDWTAIAFRATATGEAGRLVASGAPLFVRVPGGPRIPATATRVGEPAPDGSVALEVRPAEPPGAAPQPGAPGEILVLTGDHEAFVVPAAAVLVEKGQAVVYLVTTGGDLVRTTVIVGDAARGDRVEVSGVKRFDAVAVWDAKR